VELGDSNPRPPGCDSGARRARVMRICRCFGEPPSRSPAAECAPIGGDYREFAPQNRASGANAHRRVAAPTTRCRKWSGRAPYILGITVASDLRQRERRRGCSPTQPGASRPPIARQRTLGSRPSRGPPIWHALSHPREKPWRGGDRAVLLAVVLSAGRASAAVRCAACNRAAGRWRRRPRGARRGAGVPHDRVFRCRAIAPQEEAPKAPGNGRDSSLCGGAAL
jgi:hypothetical protein